MTATGPSNTSAVRLSLNFEPIKAGTGLCYHAEAGIGFYVLLFYAMARIRRNTCSAVSAKFAPAFSVFIASSRVTTPLSIGKNASIPSRLQATASFATQPEKPITGFPYFFAVFATPMGAFPITV